MYQNLSYKINVPSGNIGTFSLWGIGATDLTAEEASGSPDEWVYNKDREETETPTQLGAGGISHRILLGNRASLSTRVSASGNGGRWNRVIVPVGK